MTSSHSELPFLNTCRWISAFLVVYGHVFLLVYPAFTPHESLVGAGLAAAAKLRYLAVEVFFVISGYLIGGGVLRNLDRFSWPTYATHRFARIYMPLVPAILLTVILDHLAMALHGNNLVYTGVWPTHVLGNLPLIANYRVVDVLSTVFSFESVLGNPIGSNAPLWSLGLEWCFYFIFPFIVIMLRLKTLASQAAGVMLVSVGLWFIIGDLTSTWLLWCAGALVSRWLSPAKVKSSQCAIALAVAIVSVFGGLVVSAPIKTLLSVTFGIAFAVCLQNRAVMRISLGKRADKALADMSYSLYITHAPVAVFGVCLAMNFAGMQSSGYQTLAQGSVLFASLMTLTVLVAWVFSVYFERRTPVLRRFLQAKVAAKSVVERVEQSRPDLGGRPVATDR